MQVSDKLKIQKSYVAGGETTKVRGKVLGYVEGLRHGIDIGYGGGPVHESAITLDQPIAGRSYYGHMGNYPQHLQGDARDLYWFRDGVLDYVFSSHLLEDFPDPKPVLDEWFRVLRKDGLMILLLPDEKRYRAHCDLSGQPYNTHHTNGAMSVAYMERFFKENYPAYEIVEAHDIEDDYGFLIIVKKN